MSINSDVKATYYSLVGAANAVLLVARWCNDHPTGATCWIELDREEYEPGDASAKACLAAWENIKERNRHLL